MGRQWNQIIESLGPLTGGTMSINANLTDIEALLTTLQADVADGIVVTSGSSVITNGTLAQLTNGTVGANLRDGSGNAITSTVSGSSRRLDVMLSSGGTTGSAVPTNANLVGGTDGTNLRALSVDSSGRLNTNINGTVPVSGTFWQATQPVSGTVTANNQIFTSTSGTLDGTSAVGTDLISSIDVGGISEVNIQFTSFPSGGANVQAQISNDNTTFVVAPSLVVTNATSSPTTTITTSGMVKVALLGARYFRLRVSVVGTSGTYSFSYVLNPRTTTQITQPTVFASATSTQSVSVSGTVAQAPGTGSGHQAFHKNISAAGTNSTLVRSSPTNIGFIHLYNSSSFIRYFKAYNVNTAPTAGSTTNLFFNYAIPPNSNLNIDMGWAGIRLNFGFGYTITGGQADNDTTAINAGDVMVNMAYV